MSELNFILHSICEVFACEQDGAALSYNKKEKRLVLDLGILASCNYELMELQRFKMR